MKSDIFLFASVQGFERDNHLIVNENAWDTEREIGRGETARDYGDPQTIKH